MGILFILLIGDKWYYSQESNDDQALDIDRLCSEECGL